MRLTVLPALTFSLMVSVGPSHAIRPQDRTVPGEVVVRSSRPLDLSAIKAGSAPQSTNSFVGVVNLLPDVGTATKSKTPGRTSSLENHLYLLKAPSDIPVTQLVEEAKRIPGVFKAEPNYIGSLSYVPADPQYPQTADHFGQVGMEDAWDVQQGGIPAVIVAVIDSGVDPNHVDLDATIHPTSFNFADDNTTIFDDLAHGTRVAGIIAAEEGNGEGIAGAAFGVQILSLDIVDSNGVLTSARAIAAIDYAVVQGAQVINMSFSFFAFSQLLEEACDEAAQQAVLVASSGNEGQSNQPVYPASFDSVIGVGATNLENDDRAPFSNFNGLEETLVDLVAPGVNIYTTIPGSLYDGIYTTGTSFAAPIVSGVAALMQSKYPTQTPEGIRQHLRETAVPLGAWAGNGKVSAKNALEVNFVPKLTVAGVEIDDSTAIDPGNDDDGAWDKGETVHLIVNLKNQGRDATGLTATLTTTDPEVTVTDSYGTWGDLDSGNLAQSNDSFTVIASPGAISHNATLELHAMANNGDHTDSILIFLGIEDQEFIPDGTNYFAPVTWTSDRTWVVEGQLNVFDDLTIEPGTSVRAAEGGIIEVLVRQR